MIRFGRKQVAPRAASELEQDEVDDRDVERLSEFEALALASAPAFEEVTADELKATA